MKKFRTDGGPASCHKARTCEGIISQENRAWMSTAIKKRDMRIKGGSHKLTRSDAQRIMQDRERQRTLHQTHPNPTSLAHSKALPHLQRPRGRHCAKRAGPPCCAGDGRQRGNARRQRPPGGRWKGQRRWEWEIRGRMEPRASDPSLAFTPHGSGTGAAGGLGESTSSQACRPLWGHVPRGLPRPPASSTVPEH